MRVPFGIRVEVLAKPQGLVAEVMNISQKGFLLQADATAKSDASNLTNSLAQDQPVYLVLDFRGDTQPVRARGVVAWKDHSGVGINFVDPPERLRDFISDLQDSGATTSLMSQVESGRIELA